MALKVRGSSLEVWGGGGFGLNGEFRVSASPVFCMQHASGIWVAREPGATQ